MMRYTYRDLAQAYQWRKKGSDWKSLERCLRLWKGPDESFEIRFSLNWKGDPTGRPFVRVSKNNIYTLLAGEVLGGSTTARYRLKTITGVWAFSDTRSHGNKLQPIRVFSRNDPVYNTWRNTLPYTDGLRIDRGEFVNPEIAVDQIRRVKQEARTKVRRQFRDLSKLAKVLSRLDGGLESLVREAQRRNSAERCTITEAAVLDMVNFEDPTTDDLIPILQLGLLRTWWAWYSRELGPYYKRVADNGFKRLRKHIYATEGAYELVPVNN